MIENVEFQAKLNSISWKLHFNSSVRSVYSNLVSNEARKSYWAESCIESQDSVRFVFQNGVETTGRILEQKPNARFVIEYFDWVVSFDLQPSGDTGTDMTMTCTNVEEANKSEAVAGWVSWLLTMKAAVDFGIDLRNHDRKRTWYHGFVDN